MQLPTEEDERYDEVQEWACDIFASGKRRRVQPTVKEDSWPSPDQPTHALAAALDAGAVRRRATHALRSAIQNSLAWASTSSSSDDSQDDPKAWAAELANVAVVLHIATRSIRAVIADARKYVGLWMALCSGSICTNAIFRAPTTVLQEYGRAASSGVKDTELQRWKLWKGRSDALTDEPIRADMHNGRTEKHAGRTSCFLGFDSLRPYQREALEAVEESSPSNCCLVLPCGAGKTKVGSAISCRFLEDNPEGCVLVMCMRREGVRQWSNELMKSWQNKPYEAVGVVDTTALSRAQVVLVTYQRLLSDGRKASHDDHVAGHNAAISSRIHASPNTLLVADECHMVPAPKIGALLRSLVTESNRLVGLTATLLREDGKDANDEAPWPILGRCVYRQHSHNSLLAILHLYGV